MAIIYPSTPLSRHPWHRKSTLDDHFVLLYRRSLSLPYTYGSTLPRQRPTTTYIAMLFNFGLSPRSHHIFAPQIYPRDCKTGNYGLSAKKPVTNTMKAEIDGPTSIAERSDSMHPPTSSSPRKQGITTSPSSYSKPPLDSQGGKRRQSRFDPMGSDADEEGYGDIGHRHRRVRGSIC